jgi:hypothetical protein
MCNPANGCKYNQGIGTYSFSGPSCFVRCHVFDCALDFDEVDVLVAEGDYAVENGLDLGMWCQCGFYRIRGWMKEVRSCECKKCVE